MHVYFIIAALLLAGEGELGSFEDWPGDRQGRSSSAVRVVGTYETRLVQEGTGQASFYVLDDPPQLFFGADGPAIVVLKIRGSSEGEVILRIDLDARERREEKLRVVLEESRELFLRVPAGMHLFCVVASEKVLILPAKAERDPPAAGAVVDWQTSGGERAEGSAFWRYRPDLSKVEWKEDEPPRRWDLWMNAGVGPVALLNSSTAGLVLGGSVDFRIDHYLLMIRCTYAMEMSVLGPEPSESHWEVSPLFGFVLKGRAGWISGAAGVGIVGGVKRGKLLEHGDIDKYASVDFLNVGFPLDVQLFLKPPAFLNFGLGLNLYANLSPDYSVFGLMLSIMIGV
jgi:hypothetical protein